MAAADRAVTALRDRILTGRLSAGERLGEVELAELLGMSRTPVREALRLLAAEGLVEVASHRGARVSAWSAQELEHVFALRARLEGMAAGEAALLADDEQIARLDDLARGIARYAEPGPGQDLARVDELNSAFHGALVAIVGSSTLAGALSGLVHASVIGRTRHAFDEAAMSRSTSHHLEIVAALRARDPEWAESVMRSHLLSARASLLGPRRQGAQHEEPRHG